MFDAMAPSKNYNSLMMLFRDGILRQWTISQTMQICFLALNNFVDEMAYHVLKEQELLIIPLLRKSWVDLCHHIYKRQSGTTRVTHQNVKNISAMHGFRYWAL